MQAYRFTLHGQREIQALDWPITDCTPYYLCPNEKKRGLKSAVLGFLSLVLLPCVCLAADKAKLSETEKINYSVGYQIGGDFKAQGVELAPDVLVRGIQDALNKNEPLLSQEQMNTTLIGLKKKVVADQQRLEKQAAAENRKASAAFLKENAAQKGVTVLPSGVQYKVLKAGSGKKPTLKDSIAIKYRATRPDGKEIASTDTNTPKSYLVAQAIPGLQEVLPLMAEGAKWQIVLPAATAAGGRDPLDDMGIMIYEMELVSVLPAK